MRESQRRELLETLGVKNLYPRFIFAGAKPSVVIKDIQQDVVMAQPVVSETNTTVIPVVDAGQNTEIIAAVSHDNVGKITVDLNQHGKAPKENRIVLPLGEKAQDISLRLRHRVVRVGELMMVLDQPTLEWHEQKEAKLFFADIYFALTGKKIEYWSEVQFDWPPSKQFPFANDADMARQALQTFIQEQQHPPCKYILAWGQKINASLFAATAQTGEVVFLDKIPVLVLDSCQHYWQETGSKYLLWQHLQNVRKRLIANA